MRAVHYRIKRSTSKVGKSPILADINPENTHTHTHTHIYIYIHANVYMKNTVARLDMRISASLVSRDPVPSPLSIPLRLRPRSVGS